MLRRSSSKAERKLWNVLRRHQMEGVSFRRQQPIGPYVVDFFCPHAKLVIEVDGGQHADDRAVIRDDKRTHWLESRGYRVLRFWNNDVLQNLEGVWQLISIAIAKADPPPQPSPSRGEGVKDA
jgi:very-short-patch-repair endonuclease